MKNNIFKFGTYLLVTCSLMSLTACGQNDSHARKGWDLYCSEGASSLNITVEEYKEVTQKKLLLNYVYLNEEQTVYYQGVYSKRSKFYFEYDAEENSISGSTLSKYEDASTQYLYDKNGYTGYFDFRTSEDMNVEYTVKFYNDSELLYTTSVKEGEPAIYNGPTPTKPSQTSGSVVTTYTFEGWDKDISEIYEDMSVNATFTSNRDFNSEYDSISDKEGVIEYLRNKGKSYSSSFYYDGDYISTTMRRYEISSIYFGYVSSHDLFAIADGSYPVTVFFKYQRFNSTAEGFGVSNDKYIEITSATVNNHKLTGCSSNSLKDPLAYAVFIVNKFLADKGYGYLTD